MLKKQCSYCEKEFTGYTEKQVDYLIDQHKLSKHKEKLRWSDD